MKSSRPIWPILLPLFGLSLAILLIRHSGTTLADVLKERLTLAALPGSLQSHLGHVLFVPLGGILVVLVRLTLGLRVLGPFRAILLAVAFQLTGISWGILFLCAVTAIIVVIRPWIRLLGMPYFGRISVMLSVVALVMIGVAISGHSLHLASLEMVAAFPVVALCLVGDAFARTFKKEGARSALWRGGTTALIAVALSGLALTPGLRHFLLGHPELLFAQIGCIILVSVKMDWRVLKAWNPPPSVAKKSRTKTTIEEKPLALLKP